LRTSLDNGQRILVLANLGPQRQTIDLRSTTGLTAKANLLSPFSEAAGSETVALAGYEVAWLEV
jgi:hypothetical protein